MVDDIIVQEVAQLNTVVGLFKKQFTTVNKKVKVVGSQGKASRSYDFDLDEEANYLELAGFQSKGKGN